MNYDWVYPEIGKRIAQRRKALGNTQEWLAPQVGLSRTSLANIERGRQKILVHQLLAFASALDLEPTELLPRRTSAMRPADMKFSTELNARQKAMIAHLMFDEPTQPMEGEPVAKQTNKR